MSLSNSMRRNCRDVFKAFLVRFAEYAGLFEFPVIKTTQSIPNRLISFSKALSSTDYDQWVHFYEDDYLFERLWNNPQKYLEKLSRFNGVILPDFSLYRDMPFVMQLWNIYRSRAIGCWLQNNGVTVIPNIRYGDKRTFRICCDGIGSGGVIAIGTHGTIKNKEDKRIFSEGLSSVVKIVSPSVIIVYGSAPDDIFSVYRDSGILIVNFESDYSVRMKALKGVI
ncbi:MAG: DUF4417 domain-containing protein [Clostridiales bacterium]|nr:DUF4417 domain-containing protein [Clostridiales bacterium]